MSPGERAYLNAVREGFGLPPLRPGPAECLKCGKTFLSEDIASNRLCGPCKEENSYIYAPDLTSLEGVYQYIDKMR